MRGLVEEPALRSRELGYSPVLPSVGLEVSQLLAWPGLGILVTLLRDTHINSN